MDYMVRGTAGNGHVRIFACVSREICETAREIHDTTPNATAALGRLLTGGVMMGLMMKNDNAVLSLSIKSDGPMKGLTVSADSHGHVKGFPYVAKVPFEELHPGKLNVGKSVGNGTLTVIRDEGAGEPYSSQTDLLSGEIAEDLTVYFAESEQVPSAVGLGVLVGTDTKVQTAGGFIVQMMPDATEEDISAVENGLRRFGAVTDHFAAGKTPEDLVNIILSDINPEILDKTPIEFKCNCSRDRVGKALISIGKKDLKEIIDEGKPVELGCNYCRSKYTFTVDEIEKMVNKK